MREIFDQSKVHPSFKIGYLRQKLSDNSNIYINKDDELKKSEYKNTFSKQDG